MGTPILATRWRRNLGRKVGLPGAILAVALGWAGCTDETAEQFRAAAAESIESGVTSIANGIIQGIFTVANPTTNGNSSNDSNTTTGG